MAGSTARRGAPALLLLLTLTGAAPPAGVLEVALDQLRSSRGEIRLCLTRDRRHFPDCKSDPRAVKHSASAAGGTVRIAGIAPGAYALSVIHDENGNGRLDRFAGVPREGFGFSRNPAIRFGPPGFEAVVFGLGAGTNRQSVRIRYLL